MIVRPAHETKTSRPPQDPLLCGASGAGGPPGQDLPLLHGAAIYIYIYIYI